MPTPPKPFSVLKSEKKSHRTKKELKQRQESEAALSTGVALKERPYVKNDPVAHKEFRRINNLLKGIEKNDAIYEPVINRYCMIQAECVDLEQKREEMYELIQTLKETFYENIDELDPKERVKELKQFTNNMACLAGSMIEIDKQVQSKRKMLLDIEKENIMTIAAALRCIPKKPENKPNKLLEVLGGD